MTKQSSDKVEQQGLRILYKRTFLHSYGVGLINPFIPIYAVQLSASPTELGLVKAVNLVSPSISQIPWGLAVDKIKKRRALIFLSGLLYAFMLLPLLYVKNSAEFIIAVSLSSIFSAMSAPALSSLMGDYSGKGNRGRFLAKLNAMASLGSMPATVISGYILYKVGGTTNEMYRIPILLSFLFIITAAFITLKIKEKPSSGETFSFRGWAKALKVNPYFKRLCILSTTQGFFMGIAWPLFTLTVVDVIKADMFQISLLSVISASTAVIVRRFTGRIADRAGRKPLLVIGRGGLFMIPLIYALANSLYELVLVDFIVGILTAASDVAVSAYLLDISPKGARGSYVSLYNALTGTFTFIGSITGGYMMDALIGLGFEFREALFVVYMVSTIGRFIPGILHVTIQEPYKYPAKFEEELTQIFREEVEAIDKMIKDYKRIEDEDIEWFENLSDYRAKRP